MIKRIQNKVAESRLTLPVTMTYSIVIWLLAGLIKENWWIQFSCFLLAVYLMLLLNNENVLVRVYSRSVSSTYAILFCMAVSLMPSVSGAIINLLIIVSLSLLYRCYQDKCSPGLTFYSFLCLGIASLVDIRIFLFLPVYWVTMMIFMYSFSLRTFMASLIGLVTPYWMTGAWYLIWGGGQSLIIQHFSDLKNIELSFSYSTIALPQMLLVGFILILFLIGAIHFIITSYQDKIRVRQIYYHFMLLAVYSTLLIILQPQLYDIALLYLIIAVSPIIGHFFTLSCSRFSNIMFLVSIGLALILTAYNLWSSSSIS